VDIFSPPPPGTLATPATHPALKPLPTYDAVVRPTPEPHAAPCARFTHRAFANKESMRKPIVLRESPMDYVLLWRTCTNDRSRIVIAVLEEIRDSSLRFLFSLVSEKQSASSWGILNTCYVCESR
jgi:hypothetical protein